MSNPISYAFKKAKSEKRPALLTYTVAGDSSKKQSLEILKSISGEVDILEIAFRISKDCFFELSPATV